MFQEFFHVLFAAAPEPKGGSSRVPEGRAEDCGGTEAVPEFVSKKLLVFGSRQSS